jgi:hypothetical protein
VKKAAHVEKNALLELAFDRQVFLAKPLSFQEKQGQCALSLQTAAAGAACAVPDLRSLLACEVW